MDKYYFAFMLNGLPETTNQRNTRGWRANATRSKKWKLAVAFAAAGKKPPKPLAKAKLTMTRHSSNDPDFDGLVSSFKNVVDALVECEIIENDKMRNIGESKYAWESAPRNKGFITVVIEEI